MRIFSQTYGREFAFEVHVAIMRIIQFPEAYARFSINTRKCIINRFPYGILYAIKEQQGEIYILAVMNLHQKPDFWQERR